LEVRVSRSLKASTRPRGAAPAGRVVLASALLAGAVVGRDAAAATYVRVNQVGYESGRAARAYVMTTASLTSESFQVLDASGHVAASGTVGATTGKWGGFRVYPVDFDVTAAGTYTIRVTGSAGAVSPAFAVDTAAKLFARPLANALAFYQVQRDGPDYIRSALRTAPAHLNDASARVYRTPRDDGNDSYTANLSATGETMDASGGWFDAGDYVKFVETTSYTVGVMLTGVRDFPAQMGPGSPSDFSAEARFGLQWLLKMWDDTTRTLHYQVGIGIDFTTNASLSDHDFWRLPQADDKATPSSDPAFAGTTPAQLQYIVHRPVLLAAPAGSQVSPNLAGRLAADFALCFQVFRKSDAALADRCLVAAEHVYALADTAPTRLVTASPADFYPESVWQDDMEWGATELALALRQGGLPAGLPQTRASTYLADAANWARAYIAQGRFDSLNLYDVAGLAHFDLHRAMAAAGHPSLAVTPAALVANMNAQLKANAGSDPFDDLYTWSAGDSASHMAGLSVMASELGQLSSSASDTLAARRQAAGLLGANGWGVSFVIGAGSTFPDCPQHQIANLVGSHDGSGRAILAGAVVEGPTDAGSSGSLAAMKSCGGKTTYQAFDADGAVYWDWVQSYSTDEPAIDLTASSMLMFAWRIAGAPAAL
jgi:endoglucanase